MLDVEWSIDHENILVEWADKAMCYRWLHGKAIHLIPTKRSIHNSSHHHLYVNRNSKLRTRPCSSCISGFFVMIGGFNILAGIISTIQHLKITQLNEAHRVSSIAWDKFYRNIKIELAKHPKERLPVIQFLKMCKEEYDRLMETSPVIPDDIVKQFTIAFGQDKYTEIVRPEICDALISTRTSRNPWYTEENQKKQQTKAFKDTLTKNAEQKRIHQHNTKTITDFQRSFFDLNNREPMNEEIFDNLKKPWTQRPLNKY